MVTKMQMQDLVCVENQMSTSQELVIVLIISIVLEVA